MELQEVIVEEGPKLETQEIEASATLGEAINTNSSVVTPVFSVSTSYSTPIFIRGLESRHTVISMDGMLLKDPGATDSMMNLSAMSSDSLDRASFKFGTDAAMEFSGAPGGVIDLGVPNQIRNHFKLSSGIENKISFGQKFENNMTKVMLFGDGSVSSSQKRSHAKGGSEIDDFSNRGLGIKLLSLSKDNLLHEFFARASAFDIEGDPAPNKDGNEDIAHTKISMANYRLRYEVDDVNRFQFRISDIQINRLQKSSYDDIEFDSNSFQNEYGYKYGDNLNNIDTKLYYESSKLKSTSITGASSSLVDLSSTLTKTMDSNVYKVKATLISHSEFDQRGLIAIKYAHNLDDMYQIGVGLSSTYNPPNLYQLYGPDTTGSYACKVGNRSLSPEIGENAEIAISKKSASKFIQLKVFDQKVRNFISFDCSEGYENKYLLESKGIEALMQFELDEYKVNTQLSLMDFNLSSGEKLLRRPEEKLVLDIVRSISSMHSFSFNINWMGMRYDTDNVNTVEVAPMTTVDAHWLIQNNNLNSYLKILNIGGVDNSQIYGFNGTGRVYEFGFNYFY